MGCLPAKMVQKKDLEIYDVNSGKLPKTVLEGFDKIIKSSILPSSKIPKPKPQQTIKKPPEKKTESNEVPIEKKISHPETELDTIPIPTTKREDPEKSEPEAKPDQNELIESQVQSKHGSSENSPSSPNIPRQNTEKPVFQNMNSVLIFEGFD